MANNPNAQKEEQLGRNIFDTLAYQLGWNVRYTTDQFNPVDFHVTLTDKEGDKHDIAGEIKNRKPSDIKYNTHIITWHKIDALLQSNNQIGFFVNIFGNDIFIYNVAEIERLVRTHKLMTKQKYLPNKHIAGTGYHYEEVVEVSKSLSVHFQLVDEKWVKVSRK